MNLCVANNRPATTFNATMNREYVSNSKNDTENREEARPLVNPGFALLARKWRGTVKRKSTALLAGIYIDTPLRVFVYDSPITFGFHETHVRLDTLHNYISTSGTDEVDASGT